MSISTTSTNKNGGTATLLPMLWVARGSGCLFVDEIEVWKKA